jgi:hypothetical protein
MDFRCERSALIMPPLPKCLFIGVRCKSTHITVHTFSPQPSTERGRSVQLAADPKGRTLLYTNGRSVIMRDLAVSFLLFLIDRIPNWRKNIRVIHAKQQSLAFLHQDIILLLAVTLSQTLICFLDAQGNIRIWDVRERVKGLTRDIDYQSRTYFKD